MLAERLFLNPLKKRSWQNLKAVPKAEVTTTRTSIHIFPPLVAVAGAGEACFILLQRKLVTRSGSLSPRGLFSRTQKYAQRAKYNACGKIYSYVENKYDYIGLQIKQGNLREDQVKCRKACRGAFRDKNVPFFFLGREADFKERYKQAKSESAYDVYKKVSPVPPVEAVLHQITETDYYNPQRGPQERPYKYQKQLA